MRLRETGETTLSGEGPADLEAIEQRWNLYTSVSKDYHEKPDLRRVIRECRQLRERVAALEAQIEEPICADCINNPIDMGTAYCTRCGGSL